MATDLTRKTDNELENILMDLCGKLELNSNEIELLKKVEEEREKRFEEARR